MEVISIKHPHQFLKEEFFPMALALGYFDGVHLGHQKVILSAKEIADQNHLKSAVMTFDPHPSVVLGRSVQHVEYITPLPDKIKLLSELGIDYLFVVHFTAELASLLPQEFVDQYIIGLNVKHVVAGFDFTYGRMGKGSMETLTFHSRGEFTHTTISKLATDYNEKISSTLIRKVISQGKMDILPDLLGRYYTTEGIVVHGDKRGRTIGFPTANVKLNEKYLYPPLGVFAVRVCVGGKWYEGVCNVGFKPTFNQEKSDKPIVEVHIFDFNEEIYGENIVVEWHRYLRSEQKFSGIEALVSQIELDKQNALLYFENNKS